MIEKNDRLLDQKLSDITDSSDIMGNIWVVDQQGTVRHSSVARSNGTLLLPASRLAAMRDDEILQIPMPDHGSLYRSVRILPNKPACHRCHGPKARYNGAIVIDLSMRETNEHVREEVIGVAAILLTALLVMGGTILALWKMLISRRLGAVIEKVRLVKEGIYGPELPDPGPDELTSLVGDVNGMALAIQLRDAEKEGLLRQLSAANSDLVNEIGMRKQWETRLQEQKVFSDALIQNSAVATFVLDTAHRVVIWNRACEQLTGIPASVMVSTSDQWKPFYRIPRKTLADVVLDGARDDLAGLYGSYSRSALSDNALHAEGWYENMNGKERYLIFDAAPILSAAGEVSAVIETLQDVTGQKRVEAALAASESKLRTIIETEPECVKLVATNGRILEINRAGLEMLQADSLDQIGDRTMLSFIVPEHRSQAIEHLSNISRGEPEAFSFEIIGLKGKRRWLESRGAPLLNGKGQTYALLSVTRDVTERKQWERRLQEQLQFLQTLMETIPMPVFYKDRNGLYQGCNRAFEDFLGTAKEQLIGRSVYDVASKEFADEYHKKDNELFAHPGIQVYEHAVRHSDGSFRHVVFNKATFTDQKGVVAGMLGIMHDITARKNAEAALQESETRFRELADLLPQPIYEADLQGTILFGNQSAFDYFGYGAAELGKIRVADLIVPQDRERARQNLENLLKGEPSQGHEYLAERKDGTFFPVLVFSAPVVRHGKTGGVPRCHSRHYRTQTDGR